VEGAGQLNGSRLQAARRYISALLDDFHFASEPNSPEAMAGRQIRRVPVADSENRLVGIVALGDLADDRVPETEKTLRSISHPAEPDRTERQRDGDPPWPPYGEGTGGPTRS
jgi:hypothetical protein